MRQLLILTTLVAFAGCERFASDDDHRAESRSQAPGSSLDRTEGAFGGDLTEEDLDAFFRKHTVSGKHVVAVKKLTTISGQSAVSYLSTIHGYPDNLGVCKELIAPYNEDPSLSVIPATYFCEVLR